MVGDETETLPNRRPALAHEEEEMARWEIDAVPKTNQKLGIGGEFLKHGVILWPHAASSRASPLESNLGLEPGSILFMLLTHSLHSAGHSTCS